MTTELEAFMSSVLDRRGSAYKVAAMALSVCLAATSAELRELISYAWFSDDDLTVSTSVDELLDSPLVEETAAGFRMNLALGPLLSLQFMNEAPGAFRRAHEFLADREGRQLDAP